MTQAEAKREFNSRVYSLAETLDLWKSLMTVKLGNFQELEQRLGAQHQ